MMNFFGYNFTFPYGMSNWFMPSWSFFDYFSQYQTPNFNIFNNLNLDNWFPSFSLNYNTNQITQPSLFSFNYNNFGNKAKSDTGNTISNTDTFTRTTKNYKTDNLKLDDYNAFKGERLANIALNRSVGWTGYCAAYVKSDIQAAGLGSYKYGHAYQMSDILKNNKNFKEISPENVDVSKLPAGCVLVYDKGTEGYSKKYGHTEITTGDGRAVSDGITKNLHKKPSSIFIPV